MRKNTLLYFVILTTFFLSACIIKGRVVDGSGLGVAGITVTLSGDDSMTATTDSNGDYQLGTLAHMVDVGSYIITPSKSGCTFDPASTNVTIINESLGDLDVPWPVDVKDFVAVCSTSGDFIIDHNCTDLTRIPQSAIEQAKSNLHIAYGHTSHGSQLTTGMDGLVSFANGGGLDLSLPTNIFAWLDLDDYFVEGDLGNPDRTTWAQRTRDYLNNPANSDVNVVIWSWCGEVDASETEIDLYLSLMSQLELDYPAVHFVYMTGHADGSGLSGNVHIRNQQIRNYCQSNGKILYDFYDIECYDPDGNYFGDKYVLDSCEYDSDGDADPWGDANWATEWQNSHEEGVDWYDCESAHSESLNANRKAYAAWWLWARLAGWNP